MPINLLLRLTSELSGKPSIRPFNTRLSLARCDGGFLNVECSLSWLVFAPQKRWETLVLVGDLPLSTVDFKTETFNFRLLSVAPEYLRLLKFPIVCIVIFITTTYQPNLISRVSRISGNFLHWNFAKKFADESKVSLFTGILRFRSSMRMEYETDNLNTYVFHLRS